MCKLIRNAKNYFRHIYLQMTQKKTLTFNESSVRRRIRYRVAVLNLFLSPSPVCPSSLLPTPHCHSPPSRLPADYRNSQVAVISHRYTQHHCDTRVKWEKSLATVCELSDATGHSRDACAFSRVTTDVPSPRVRPIDKSNAYPSRPRDGLRFAPAAQRRRDPWRHRELNPRPHTRAAIRLVFVRSAPRDLVPPAPAPRQF